MRCETDLWDASRGFPNGREQREPARRRVSRSPTEKPNGKDNVRLILKSLNPRGSAWPEQLRWKDLGQWHWFQRRAILGQRTDEEDVVTDH